jgi:hypothetical protein
MAAYGRAYGLRSVSLRYFNVAGATERLGEDHDPETHLVPNVLAAAAGTGRELTLYGDDYPTADGTCIRDYIDVADLADAHLRALEATAPGDARTDEPLVCNLGSGGGFSVREVISGRASSGSRPVHGRSAARGGDRRSSWRPSIRAAECWAGARRSNLEAMIGSAGPGAGAIRPASRTEPPTSARAARRRRQPLAGPRSRLAGAAPAVAHRPDEPRPDQHRHEQAQHGDLVRRDAQDRLEHEQDDAEQQLADDLRALSDEPVQPEELAQLLGRREPHHQHPVGHLDPAEAAAEDRSR